jgi:hypothetical protein
MIGLKGQACLLAASAAGWAGCLNLNVDPEDHPPETITALQWELRDAETDQLLEKGCAEGTPEAHVAKGQRVKLRLIYEDVKRKASETGEPCKTDSDLSRKPTDQVLAPRCRVEFATPNAADLVSFDTVPANAPVDGDYAAASGYDYVLDVYGTGTVEQNISPQCSGGLKTTTLVRILAPVQ